MKPNIQGMNLKHTASFVSWLQKIFGETLLLFEKDPVWKDRKGAYFCLADKEHGLPLLIVAVGEVPLEKAEKYLSFCQEKAKRLAQNPEHLASWESRNPDTNKWGGAVRGRDFIYSMSGLPEMGDEVIMLMMDAVPHCELPHEIAKRTSNPYWNRLYQFLMQDI